MSSDPGNGAGDSGDDDLEERKTRLVPRPDIVDRAAAGNSATASATTIRSMTSAPFTVAAAYFCDSLACHSRTSVSIRRSTK